MVQAHNTSAKEDEAERLWVHGLPELYNKSLFLKEGEKSKGYGIIQWYAACLATKAWIP